MWAESYRWAADALNRSATTANPDKKSPDEVFFGEVPEVKLLPFFEPGYCTYKRTSKCMPKAQECFYLGPGYNYPRDSMRMQTKGRYVITTRNVTWQHSPPPTSQPAFPFSMSGKEFSQDVEGGEGDVESSGSDSDESDLGAGGRGSWWCSVRGARTCGRGVGGTRGGTRRRRRRPV